jgi:hypothetical protein
MEFKIVYAQDKAEADVAALLDKKKIFPKQRERLHLAIEAVVEAMTYGFVTIDESGRITQKLVDPVGELTELHYAARVDPATINKAISSLRVDNQTNRNMVYLKSYTGQLEATINRLEATDRNTADSIAFFFQ